MHHPTERIVYTTAFVTPVVEHWLDTVSKNKGCQYACCFLFLFLLHNFFYILFFYFVLLQLLFYFLKFFCGFEFVVFLGVFCLFVVVFLRGLL